MKQPLTASSETPIPQFLLDGSKMRELIRSIEWSDTSLGHPAEWPQSLKTTLNVLLNAQFPMFLFWGEDLICFYNDAFRLSFDSDGKHPSALGRKGPEAWPEIWLTIKPWLDQVQSVGEAIRVENQLIGFYRNGRIEDIYWTFNYSPVYEESGKIGGVLIMCQETTEKVLSLQKSKEDTTQLQNIFKQAPAAIAVVHGPEHIYTVANLLYQKLFGRTEEQLIGHSIRQVWPEVEGQGIYELFDRVFTSGQPYIAHEFPAIFTERGETKTGYYEFVAQPIKNSEGKVTDVMIHAFEVTEQIQARKKIEESEQQVRTLNEQLATELSATRHLQQFSSQNIYEQDVTKIYEQLLETAIALMQSDFASIQLYDQQTEQLILLASKNFHPKSQKFWQTVFAGSGSTCGEALRSGSRIMVADVEESHFMKGTEDLNSYRISGIRAVQSTPLISRDGKFVGMISTHWENVHQPSENDFKFFDVLTRQAADLIEQKTAQQKIRESEEHLRALVNATSDVVYRMSPDWSEMCQLEGRDFLSGTGEPIRNWLQKYIHPEDQQQVKDAIKEAVQTKTIFELEHQVLQADGGLGWTFSRAIPILNRDGKIIEWFGAASDITKRKQAEEALRTTIDESEKQKRLYEAITQSTPDLIYIFDLNYRFSYANQALLTMWGRTQEDSIGRGLLELGYEPWHAEMHEREIDQIIATKKPIRGEVSFLHATLGRRIYDYIFVPVLNKKGEVEAVAGTTRDITEIKMAEEALKLNEEKLEKLVAKRTQELQRSNEDLQQFAHVVSHDLKEPIRKVRTFGSRLKEEFGEILPEKALTYLSKIEGATNRMYAMIDGVLLYSSLNEIEQTEEKVDLNEVVQNIETDLEVVISQKGAVIEYSDLPSIKGSSLLLNQLFYNLLNNSLKFSKASVKPLIRIRVDRASAEEVTKRNLNDGKDYIKIILQDNGIGFSQKDAERIFQTLTRLNSKDQYEGTGLGLALCKKITERHGGTIQAEGKEGEGAVFSIILPQKQS